MFKRILPTLMVALVLAAPAFAESYSVEQIEFDGLQRVSSASAKATITLLPGTLDQAAISAAVRALYDTGYYDQVEAVLQQQVLTFVVLERPQIETLTIDGTKTVPKAALENVLSAEGIREGEILDRAKIAIINQELERQYAQVGLYNAKIDIEQLPLASNRVDLTISVDEGDKAQVGAINIAGNQVFSDAQLSEAMTLTALDRRDPVSQLFGRHDFSQPQLRGDLQRLESFYLDRGYIDFSIDSQQTNFSRDRRLTVLTINVSEGEQYQLADIAVAGGDAFDWPQTNQLAAGDVFSRSQVVAVQQAMLSELNEQGYFFAQVDIQPNLDRDGRTVDLVYQVSPGPLTYVRDIRFTGNDLTNDATLRRELLQLEQSLAVLSDIRAGSGRLLRLGFLKNATVDTARVAGHDNLIDVIYRVEEEMTGNIQAQLQFSPSRGFSVGGAYKQSNLAGTGHSAAFEVEAATMTDDETGDFMLSNLKLNLSYDVPYFTENGLSLGADLFVEEVNASAYDKSDYRTNDYGLGLRTGYPTSLDSRLIWSLEAERKRLLLPNDETFVPTEILDFAQRNGNTFDTLSLGATWRYQTLEGGFIVSKGSRHQLAAKLAVPGSTSSWMKLDYQGERYWPLFDQPYWALRVHGELGAGISLDGQPMPFYELYRSGGRGSVRGLRDLQLAPRNSLGEAFGGNLKTEAGIELLTPVPFIEDKSAWRSSLFIDAGNSFTTTCDGYSATSACQAGFDFGDIRASAGVDLTWRTPLAPVSFVFALPLTNYEDDEYAGIFNFSLGISY